MTADLSALETTWAWHQDDTWNYHFSYPEGWYRFSLDGGREGVFYGPQAENGATGFGVEVKDLGVEVTEEDLPDLRAGFQAGLDALPDCQLAWMINRQVEPTIILEAKCTFREGEVTRERRSHLVYAGSRQYHVFAQGATREEFDRWRPLLNFMLMSFDTTRKQRGPSEADV